MLEGVPSRHVQPDHDASDRLQPWPELAMLHQEPTVERLLRRGVLQLGLVVDVQGAALCICQSLTLVLMDARTCVAVQLNDARHASVVVLSNLHTPIHSHSIASTTTRERVVAAIL